MKIKIITPVYPTSRAPERGKFVANLAESWVDKNTDVCVVTSLTLGRYLKSLGRPKENVGHGDINVKTMPAIGAPFGSMIPDKIQNAIREYDQQRIINKAVSIGKADVIYAKFASEAETANRVQLQTNEPYVVDLGESSSLISKNPRVLQQKKAHLQKANGLVCVSPRLLEEAKSLGVSEDRILFLPNSPNATLFRSIDKVACRSQLGIPETAFLVLFVGRFSVRKGADRVNNALAGMRNDAIAAFLGSGDLIPSYPGTVFCESVTHEKLPVWMNAADVLCLPTLAEGCCNAIAEAIACNLPIVSSNIPDITWQVPRNGAILVEPMNVREISGALDYLSENPARLRVMKAAMAMAMANNSGGDDDRPGKILEWIKTVI